MEQETLKKANSIRKEIEGAQETLEIINNAIEQTGGQYPVYTELRAACWKERISIGSLFPGSEILSIYRDRLIAKIERLEAEFTAL